MMCTMQQLAYFILLIKLGNHLIVLFFVIKFSPNKETRL